jgi:hypothetical protein
MSDAPELIYVISLKELIWGALLVAVSLFIHAIGMILTQNAANNLKARPGEVESVSAGIGILILSSWMIIVVHLSEVLVWALFFLWKGAMPNFSVSFYFSLNEYTTLGSEYNLPRDWHLLEGMIATTGLLGFAWSTGTLLTLAQDFQARQVQRLQQRREKHRHE